MFRDCAKLERNMFVTWKEDDVDVGKRKECWERKRVLSHIWVKSESDLGQISTRSLTSSNQSWYARNTLSISQKHWKDIIMNFISELFLLKDYNIICTIICHLIKKHHYVFCHWKDDDISVEEIIWIMLWNVYWLHDLSSSIVLNRDFQFISIMWQSLCKQLRITINLSTVYHFEINDQLK